MALIRSNRARDLRVDFFRGLALWWIYTDHIPGDVLGDYSLRNFAMCDATEVFVLLAGFGAGIAYGSVMDRQGYLYAAADTLRRAWTLYIAHIFLFVVYTAQVAYSAAALDRTFYLEETRLDVLADAPYRALLEALLLRFQPSLLNILPLYVALLLIFALALPLLRKPALLFAASATAYLAVRLTGINLPAWTGEGWFFNPFAWQLLFMIGAIMAYAPPRMPRSRWPIDLLALLVLAAGLIVIWVIDIHPRVLAAMPAPVIRFVITEDKTGLHPFRLLSILSLAWLVARSVPRDAGWLRSRVAGTPGPARAELVAGVLLRHLPGLPRPPWPRGARQYCDADRGEPAWSSSHGCRGGTHRLVSRQGPCIGADVGTGTGTAAARYLAGSRPD